MNKSKLIQDSEVDVVSNGLAQDNSGILVPLRTFAEAQARLTLINVHVCKVPLNLAHKVIKSLETAIPQQHDVNLHHLRRIAKAEELPPRLRPRATESIGLNASLTEAQDSLCESPGEQTQALPQARKRPTSLYLLICASSVITTEELQDILAELEILDKEISTLPVPSTPPTSSEEATLWTREYWPTIYKKHNPNGPHPSIMDRATESIRPFVADYIAVAKNAARAVSQFHIGEPFGAVIVNPSPPPATSDQQLPVIVIAAGDARWKGNSIADRLGSGNVTAHAALRAIGMIARKRRQLSGEPGSSNTGDRGAEKVEEDVSDVFLDDPITDVEKEIYKKQDTLKEGGYLCTGLEIYLTHEPCVMCSMAILHSRFDKAMFAMQMENTGGLCAERKIGDVEQSEGAEEQNGKGQGTSYGLFWRDDLNWKLLAWQWVSTESPETDIFDPMNKKNMHA
ncbi:tRNA-specific adenosine deaminase subunit tad3 [Agyrium rufum]|nr:tRNA-specific adenosine deaminase subunit tad3 [Agyrium rufum]